MVFYLERLQQLGERGACERGPSVGCEACRNPKAADPPRPQRVCGSPGCGVVRCGEDNVVAETIDECQDLGELTDNR